MMRQRYLSPLLYTVVACCVGLLAGCSTDDREETGRPQTGTLHITSSINAFQGEDGSATTRTNLAGDAFETGDRMKLKVICPYGNGSHDQLVESTWGNTFDSFWLMKWGGSEWAPITSEDKVDLSAEYAYANASSILDRYEAQQTPYVYTAQTWSENVLFVAPAPATGASTLYSQYSNVFQADQSKLENYKKCDLLWAQTYMQTGSYNIHLSFDHVMACLKIDISALGLSAAAVVTLEGMPDIDQREVVVGDYYADRSYVNAPYGYKEKSSCTVANNGKVLGVAYINESTRRAEVYAMKGNPDYATKLAASKAVANTGVYTAYTEGGYYYLIVPPCSLSAAPTVWVRDGETRFSYTLTRTSFEQGKLYPIKISKLEMSNE